MSADFDFGTAGRVLLDVSKMGSAESAPAEVRLAQLESIAPIVPDGVVQLRLRAVGGVR